MTVDDMVTLPDGVYLMGCAAVYPEEGPVHTERVASFHLDRTAVTNQDFAAFVAATGYTTTAERPLDPTKFPGSDLPDLRPGSMVFVPTPGPVDLRDWRAWWRWVPGADWRHPSGPDSDFDGLEQHPVVQVSWDDANAFAGWAGKRLPTEQEWEYASRGGLDGALYAWGDEPNTGQQANTWQGSFPHHNRGAGTGRWKGTAPVGSFPANGYGLREMTGNTWEWTASRWSARLRVHAEACSCGPSTEPAHRWGGPAPRRVLKGGSHLCAPEYCLRYRPAARSPETEDSATTHIGFRCAS